MFKSIQPEYLKITDSNRNSLIALGCIILTTVICLFPTIQNGWVNWDDPAYVLRNELIREFNAKSILAIFKTPEVAGLYHPFTLVSLAADYHFWELDPFGFHLTNLILHLFNTSLVYFLFRKLNSSILVAGIVALLFGMHPMHVESVAWISARKDVLYVLFFLLSLISYLKSISANGTSRITWLVLSLLAFTCSLLSKNVAFTLPFVLLLLDYLKERKITLRSTFNKIPFFILAVIAMFTAESGQVESDSMDALAAINFGQSIFHGMYNTVFYVIKSLVPIKLSAFHPFPTQGESAIFLYLAIFPFQVILYFVYRAYKRSREVFFGLVFFLITIAPVSQIVPFGKALSSERYTYLPYIGLFFIIALFIQKLFLSKKGWVRNLTLAVSLIWVVLIGVQTRYQSTVWENSELLWTQVIDQYPNSQWAYMSRGLHYAEQDELTLAIDDLNKSIEIEPFAQSLYERGVLIEKGDVEGALHDYYHSVKIDPTYSRSYLNIGVILAQRGKIGEAINFFEAAIQNDEDYSMAYFNCATALKINGDKKKAINYYSRAIELEPENIQYITFRGVLFLDMGNNAKAIQDFSEAIALDPKGKDVFYLRSVAYRNLNQLEKARSDAQQAKANGYPVSDEYLQELMK